MRTLCLTLLLALGCSGKRAADAGVDAGARRGPSTVQLPPTADRWSLTGTLTLGADNHGAAVLLLHQLGSSRAEWSQLVERLQRPPAVTVLALDLRGHGESVQGPGGSDERWESFGEDPTKWEGLRRDVSAGVQFLRMSGGARSVVIVGSSIGSTAALQGAAELDQVAGLVMISPGLAYHGVDVLPSVAGFAQRSQQRSPVLLVAGDQDTYSVEAVSTLGDAMGTVAERQVYPGREHGVSLCNVDPERWSRVEGFIRQALGVPRRIAAPAAVSPSATHDGGRL